jgi:hypothetical protein
MAAAPPQLLASLAISAGIVLLFVADLFAALGLETGTSGRSRLLQLLAPADLAVAFGLVVAVALASLYRAPADEPPAGGSRPTGPVLRPASFAMVAGITAAVVALTALVRGIVELTVPNQRPALRIGNVVEVLAVALIAAAAAFWGLRKPPPR